MDEELYMEPEQLETLPSVETLPPQATPGELVTEPPPPRLRDMLAQGAADVGRGAVRAIADKPAPKTLRDYLQGVVPADEGAAPVGPPVPVRRELAPSEQAGLLAGRTQTNALDLMQTRALGGQPHMARVGNPMHGPTQRFAASTVDANDRLRSGQEQVNAAEVEQLQAQKEMHDQLAMEAWRHAEQMRIRNQTRAQQQADEMKAIRASHAKMREAADVLASAPAIDPERGWKNLPTGRKIAAVLGAGFLAAGKTANPLGHINAIIERDIDAQKATFGQLQATLGARSAVMDSQRAIYQNLRDFYDDEQAADSAYRVAHLEAAKSQFEAMAAASGQQMLTAQQQMTMANLDKEIAKETLSIEKLVAANPKFRTVAVKPKIIQGPDGRYYTPEQLDALAKHQLAQSGDITGKTIDLAGKEMEHRAKAAEKAGEKQFQSEKEVTDQLQKFAASTATAQSVISKVERIQNRFKGDYPNRGVDTLADSTLGMFGAGDKAEYEQMEADLIDEFGRLRSQGAITDDEFESFTSMVRAGVGDEALHRNLENIKQSAIERVRAHEAALTEEARAHYRKINQKDLPSMEANWTGSTGNAIQKPGASSVVTVK